MSGSDHPSASAFGLARLRDGLGSPALAASAGAALVLGVLLAARLATAWSRRKLRLAAAAYEPPTSAAGRHFVVLVNPNAGAGEGKYVYEDVIAPMLAKARVSHDVVFTIGPGHARKVAAAVASGNTAGVVSGSGRMGDPRLRDVVFSSKRCECVVSASGDGMLHEVFNGVMEGAAVGPPEAKVHNGMEVKRRSPRLSAESSGPRVPLPVSVVPVGSGNGVAASLFGRGHTAVSALAQIIGGKSTPIDVMQLSYEGDDEAVKTYDLHFFCWAVFADHDYITEGPMRWMGPLAKMAVAPLMVILRRKLYKGTCDFVPAPVPSSLSAKLGSGAYADPKEFPQSPLDPSMRRIEDDFWCFAVGNLKEAGGDMAATPNVLMNEGAMDILTVVKSKAPRLSRWRCFIQFLAMESGAHVLEDDVKVLKTTRLRLEPRGGGHIQMSGEQLRMPKEGAVVVEVLPRAGRVMI